jgi:hypothetical protein
MMKVATCIAMLQKEAGAAIAWLMFLITFIIYIYNTRRAGYLSREIVLFFTFFLFLFWPPPEVFLGLLVIDKRMAKEDDPSLDYQALELRVTLANRRPVGPMDPSADPADETMMLF